MVCAVSALVSFSFGTKWWSYSVEGLLSTGPTPSSFYIVRNKDILWTTVLKGSLNETANMLISEVSRGDKGYIFFALDLQWFFYPASVI